MCYAHTEESQPASIQTKIPSNMELHEAKLHHAKLVARLQQLRKQPKDQYDYAVLENLEGEIGRYAQAWNPKIATKALAFIKGN